MDFRALQLFTSLYLPEDKKVPYGAEALMRFTSEKFGMISPAEFIPILEETGLIIPAGRWMMKELWENAVRSGRYFRVPDEY